MTQTTARLTAGGGRQPRSPAADAGSFGASGRPETGDSLGSRRTTHGPAPEIAAETATAARLSAVLADGYAGEATVAVLTGPVGASLAAVLRRATGGTGLVAWLHVLPARPDGAQRALAHWNDDDGSGGQSTTTGSGVAEVLDQLAERLEPGSTLIMDAFHALNPGSASGVIVWVQAARQRGVRVLFGYHPALDAYGVGALLNVPTGTHWLDMHPLSDELVRHDLELLCAWSPELLDAAVAGVAGNASLLQHLRRALSAEPVITAESFAHAHTTALEATTVRMVCDQGSEALSLAGVLGLTASEVDPQKAAEMLGLPASKAARLHRLLREVGLLPSDPTSAQNAFELLRHHTPVHIRRIAAGHAHDLLAAKDADKGRLFFLRATVGDQLTGALDLARAAFDEAYAGGCLSGAAEIAATLMSRSDDPTEIAWAKAAQLRCWAVTDWGRFASRASWYEDPAVAAELPILESSRYLVIEAPSVARWLPTGQRCPETEAAAGLAIAAFLGQPAEADLRSLEATLSERGIFTVSAPVASRIALAWLALADYEAANRWACVATFTAAEDEIAECGIGHLVAAQAQLRRGEFTRADEHAASALCLFTRLNAVNLGQLAALTRTHIQVETGRPVDSVEPLSAGRTHPGLHIYQIYVSARAELESGRADPAVRHFFECGRLMKRWGIKNPSLLNWSAHLVAIFRATGQNDFMRHVEDELVSSWLQWQRHEPDAAARRSQVLGSRAGDLDQQGVAPEDEISLSALSPAERRVVDLVVQGMSNRDAAKELFLSKRTVDTHLGNVYRKLGLASRDELVCVMRRLAPTHTGRALACFG